MQLIGMTPRKRSRRFWKRWISVKDHLPEEEGKYLICCSDGYRTTAEYENKTWLVYTGRYEEVEDVTHWLPLPEPPKGDDDE